MLFPSQDKRNTSDKAKGLRVSSERHIRELGVRYFSTLIECRTLRQSLIRRDRPMKTSRCMLRPPLRCGVRYMGQKKYLTLFLVAYIYSVRARIGGESALSSYEFTCVFGSLGDFFLPLHSQKKRTA